MTEFNSPRHALLVATSALLTLVCGCNSIATRGLLSPRQATEATQTPQVQPAVAEESQRPPQRSAVVPASHSQTVAEPSITDAPVQQPMVLSEAMTEPSVTYEAGTAGLSGYAIGGCSGCASGSCGGTCALPGISGAACGTTAPRPQNVQEYIYDGGDTQSDATVLKDWNVVGVDPTDTVAYYETVTGTVCVKPSNRVSIYAPRFGSVRQVTGATLATRAVGTERILAPVKPAGIQENDIVGAVVQPLAPQGQRRVSLIDRFMDSTGGVRLIASLPPQRVSDAVPTYGAVDVAVTSEILEDQPAIVGRVLQNAPTLYIIESLAVEVDGIQAAVLRDRKKPGEVVHYEIPDKCSLRICKTASHTIADSGDIVRFTLRFDNAGVKPIGNIVLTDSLSPRLEFVEGSEQSSVDTRFSAIPNGTGSKILRWEIVEPLEKYAGGVITFDCRVR